MRYDKPLIFTGVYYCIVVFRTELRFWTIASLKLELPMMYRVVDILGHAFFTST